MIDSATMNLRRGHAASILAVILALQVPQSDTLAQEQQQQQDQGADKPAQPTPAGKAPRRSTRTSRRPADPNKPPQTNPDPNNPAEPGAVDPNNPNQPLPIDPNNPNPLPQTPDPQGQQKIEEFLRQQQQTAQPGQVDGQEPPPDQGGQPPAQPGQPGNQPAGQPAGQPTDPNQPADAQPTQPQDDAQPGGRPPVRRPRTPAGRRTDPQPGQPQVVPSPAGGADLPPAGPSTVLNIPPDVNGTPPEQRKYRFSIKDGTYEQLVEGFARQTGLGVLGEAPKDGKVSFVTTEELSFEEALSRVRMLLFNYKPHEPYWLERQEMNLIVIRVTDFYRILPRERMYQSIEDMKAASLRDDELVLVIYTPTEGSVSELKEVRNFLPDYMRVTPLEDQNRVTIFGLVKDINKYLDLIAFFAGSRKDIRSIAKLEVKHITPSEAVEKIRQLIGDWESAAPKAPRAAGAGRQPEAASMFETIPAPPVTVIPEDMLGYILIRAMPEKIDEIKAMLPIVDVLPSGASQPNIIKLEHVAPDDIIPTIQQILGAAPAMATPGAPVPPAGAPAAPRRTRKGGAALGSVSAEGVTMMAHPSENSLIVLTPSKEDLDTIRGLVTMFDVPTQMKPTQLILEYSDANDIATTIMAVLGSKDPGKPPARFTLVSDPSGTSLWFSGSKTDLERVREMIRVLDLPDQAVSLHYIRLKNRKPSFIVNMLKEMESGVKQPKSQGARRRSSSGAPAVPGAPTAPGPGPMVVSKFTADDEQQILFVLCTDAEWEQYLKLIDQLEKSIGENEPFVRIPLTYIDPDTAVAKLTDMVPPMTGTNGPVRLAASANGFLVIGATLSQVDEIKKYLPEVDRPSGVEQRVFEVKFKDAAEMKTLIETLLGANPVPGPRAKVKRQTVDAKAAAAAGVPTPTAAPGSAASTSEEVTIVQLGSRLIARATPPVLDHISQILAEFDVDDDKTQLKIYADFRPGTDVVGMAESLKTIMGDAGPPGAIRKKGEAAAGGTMSDAPRFIPQPSTNKLMVVALPAQFPKIEEMIALLRNEIEQEPIEVAVLPVKHADPLELIDLIDPILSKKVGDLLKTGELVEPTVSDPATPGVPRVGRKRTMAAPGAENDRYHMHAYPQGGGIVIAAPKKIIDLARTLVEQFDRPGLQEEEIVFRTVALVNSDPASMVKSIREMIGAASPSTRARVKKDAGVTTGEPPAGPALTVVEAPTGGAVVLNGKKSEVEQAEKWIETLDSMTSRGRSIKVYKIKTADVEKLVDLVLNAIDASSRQPAQAPGQPPRPAPQRKAGPLAAPEEDDDEFATSKTWTGQDLYIQADLIDKTMLVATTESKLKLIDEIVARIDSEESISDIMSEEKEVPTDLYTLKYIDGIDGAMKLEDLFDKLWSGEKPKVTNLEKLLIIKYPNPDKFPYIRELIAEHVDQPNPDDIRQIKRTFIPPKGVDAQTAAAWLKLNSRGVNVEIEDVSQPPENFNIEQVHPQRPNGERPNRCVLPTSFQHLVSGLLRLAVAQHEDEEEEQEPEPQERTHEEDEEPEQLAEPPVREFHPAQPQDNQPQPSADEMIGRVAAEQSQKSETPKKTAAQREKETEALPNIDDKLLVRYDVNKGVFVVEGPAALVKEAEKWLKDLEEEGEDLREEFDIRIYRVRYIDVFSAQDIIEEMFNQTRAQRGALQQQQQQLMQQQRQQQQQQQRQQQQAQGKDAQGKPGEKPPAQQPGQQPGQQVQVPQAPAPAVRVYPNPRDRTLILRAESHQYPALLELLATIDQPKPFDSELEVIPLKKLNAKDVEELLIDVLGLSEKGARPAATRRNNAAGQAGGQPAGPAASGGGSLPKTIMTPTVTGVLPLGVDPEDIKLTSNEEANALVVMAPKAAITFIRELIDQLESKDIPDRVTKYYDLKYAVAGDVADQLEKHFAEGGASRPRRAGSGKGGESASAGKSLSTPTVIPYDRLNLLTVVATEKELKEVDDIVARLDAESGSEDWRDVVLSHADAKVVADTLSQMFGEGAPASSAKGGASGGSGSRGSVGARFLGQEGDRIVLYRAPEQLHEPILAAIQKIDSEAGKATSIHVIQLVHSTPSRVAQAIDNAYGRGAASAGGGKKPASSAPFTVTADDGSKRLFVRSDEKTFADVESLVKTLDVPRGVGFEFRIYPLRYANAREVHTLMTALIRSYLTAMGPSAKDVEPFSVEVNDTANALVVIGGPAVFGFLEQELPKIDNPGAAATQKQQVVINLVNADAAAVAKMVTDIFITAAPQKTGGGPAPISISALPGSNAVVVSASPATFAEIKSVIEKLDAEGGSTPRMIKLQHAKVGQVLPTILEQFDKRSAKAGQEAPAISANDALNILIVRASPMDYNAIEIIAKSLDTPESVQDNIRIIEVPEGINVTDLASQVEQAVNDGAAAVVHSTGGRGGPVPSVTIQPNARTSRLICSGPAHLLDQAERLAMTIASKGSGGGRVTSIVTVEHIELDEINALLEQLTGGGASERGNRPSRRPPTGNRRSRPASEPAPSPGRP